VPPLNRPDPVFTCASGVVDTDVYASPVHFPFFATAPDGVYTLAKGTPLVQVIPFRRESVPLEATIRAETVEEAAMRTRILRSTIAEDGWYRRASRAVRDHAAVIARQE
jgi:hypothetical protein